MSAFTSSDRFTFLTERVGRDSVLAGFHPANRDCRTELRLVLGVLGAPSRQPVQNLVDERTTWSFSRDPTPFRDCKWAARPIRTSSFRSASRRIGESIFDAYGVLVRSDFEWLNEALLIRHAPQGISRVYNTVGFLCAHFTASRFVSASFRYQDVNAPSTEPVFPDVGLRTGPSVDLRYAATESVAVQLQYD